MGALQDSALGAGDTKPAGDRFYVSGGTVHVTMDPLPRAEKEIGWQKTAGKGWQQTHTGRTFIEYRYNEKARVLLWIEGVNPRLFFAYTKKMCELPLDAIRQ